MLWIQNRPVFSFLGLPYTARSEPSQNVDSEKLICVICDKKTLNGTRKKYRISEDQWAINLRKALNILMDNTCISDLETNEHMFNADIYYHNSSFPAHNIKANRKELQVKNVDYLKRDIFKNYTLLDEGKGLSLLMLISKTTK